MYSDIIDVIFSVVDNSLSLRIDEVGDFHCSKEGIDLIFRKDGTWSIQKINLIFDKIKGRNN